jgi:tetratricopeptide (TPR) repeat protein
VEYAVDFAGKDSPPAVMALRRLARCLLALGDHAGAIEALDRALAVPPIPSLAIDMMMARHLKGRALIVSGRDPAGGRALQAEARRAAEAHANRAMAMGQLEGLDVWFAKHAKR